MRGRGSGAVGWWVGGVGAGGGGWLAEREAVSWGVWRRGNQPRFFLFCHLEDDPRVLKYYEGSPAKRHLQKLPRLFPREIPAKLPKKPPAATCCAQRTKWWGGVRRFWCPRYVFDVWGALTRHGCQRGVVGGSGVSGVVLPRQGWSAERDAGADAPWGRARRGWRGGNSHTD